MRMEIVGRPLLAWTASAMVWFLAGNAVAQQAAPANPSNPTPGKPPAEANGANPAAGAVKCDATCVRANMDRAAQACARPIEAQAPIDYDWLTRPFASMFQEADPSDDKSAVAVYRGDSIRFMNPQKEWVRVTYECAFDANAHKVIGVRVRPGRLNQPQQVGAGPQTTPKGAAKQPQVKSAALGAAIAEAARKRNQPHAASSKTVRIGEPSAIDIQQVDPSRAQ